MNETTILIVEDHAPNRVMIARRLRRRGFEVLEAEDGERGVELALSHWPDVIVMDVSMPGIDGHEATRRIRAAEGEREPVGIIALTAHDTTEERVKAEQSGFTAFEAKPIEFDRLVTTIRRLAPEKA